VASVGQQRGKEQTVGLFEPSDITKADKWRDAKGLFNALAHRGRCRCPLGRRHRALGPIGQL
jgi:hypothetical protein